MARFIIFVLLLLTGRLVRGITVTEIVRLEDMGSYVNLEIKSANKIRTCDAETNGGKVLKFNSDTKVGDIDLIFSNNRCSVHIRNLDKTHAGVWKLTAYNMTTQNENNKSEYNIANIRDGELTVFQLYVRKKKKAIPSQFIEAYDGYYVNMRHIEKYENLTACNLTGPAIGSINLLTEKQDRLQLSDQCGVHMKINDKDEGLWYLHAIVNNYILYEISFMLNVHQLKKEDPEMVVQWIRGSIGTISLSNRPKICQIVDPSGVIVETSVDKCYHVVQTVTVQHEGTWLVRYNMDGMLQPVERKIKVETFDEMTFNTSVSQAEDGSVILLCRLQLKEESSAPEACNFIRPDGKNLYMTPAVSDERYSSYVNFGRERKDRMIECGIKILKFEDVDYGTWRCDLRFLYSSRLFGSLLYVDYSHKNTSANVEDRTIKTRADEVHVKRGDSFTIKCTADVPLEYCWLRSPNGTSYSIKISKGKEVEMPFFLSYQGTGLLFGECGAKIPAAADSDHGQWTCSMGVMDGAEETVKVPVTVTETYLVAEQTEIAVSGRNDPVLSCRILPRVLDRTVHYCRWIRPDGYGIYNDVSHRYTSSSNYSQCRLVILNYQPEEDDGIWTCVAGLQGQNGRLEEAWDHIRVQWISRNYFSSRLALAIVALAFILVIMSIVGFIYGRYKLRRISSNAPPPYTPQHYPTKGFNGVKQAQC